MNVGSHIPRLIRGDKGPAMKATSIPGHEQGFRTTGKDSSGKQHILEDFEVTVQGTSETVAMVKCTRENGDDSFYFKE